jgi:signal transduction histidine kinase
MKLRNKTMLVLAGVLTCSMALNFGVLQKLIFPSFVALEESAARENLRRVEDAFKGEFRSLGATAADWGHWDDTYEFAGGEKESYVEDNLYFDSLSAMNLNFMYIFNASGQVLWGGLFDLESGEELPKEKFLLDNLPPTHRLLQHADTESLHTGFALTIYGPLYLVSTPILTNNEEGPSRGSFVIGRFLNKTEIARLRDQTHVDFQTWQLDGGTMPADGREATTRLSVDETSVVRELEKDTLSAYSLLRDASGEPVILLRADTPRKITAIGRDTIGYALILMLLVGLVAMVAIWFLLRFVVIGPLSSLTDQVVTIAQEEDHTRRLSLERGDEIGTLAQEFDAMLDKLLRKESLAMLGQITATVSHELRNPLGAMRNSIFAVAESTRGKDLGVERPLERVDRNIDRCDKIIGDLLNFARQRDPDMKPVPFDSWLEGALDRQQIPEGVSFSRSLEAADAEAAMDCEQLACVIDNLVENACHALTGNGSPGGGGGTLSVTSRVVDDHLEIAVGDDGPGIAPEVMPDVLKPLFSTKGFGVGIGLPTVKQVMEQHGGTIAIASESGQGTRVLLTLPLHRAQQAAA